MLGGLSRKIGARAVAALVALAISGAPRVAAAGRTGHEHVCQCRAHGEGHRCACPICAEQARRARRGGIAKLPPCHQKLALAEIQREEEGARSDAAIPCLQPICGIDDPEEGAPSTETYLAPRPPTLRPPQPAEPLAPASHDARETPAVPDVPPPIPGR